MTELREGLKRPRLDEDESTHNAAKKLRAEGEAAMDASDKIDRACAEEKDAVNEMTCAFEHDIAVNLPIQMSAEEEKANSYKGKDGKTDDDKEDDARDDIHTQENNAGEGFMNGATVVEGDDANGVGKKKARKEAIVGPRHFTSSMDMLGFFYDLLHGWPLNFDLNKYEHRMLEDLLKKGHQEACKKIGSGINSFQVRINPKFSTRCFYVIRKDGSMEDFSYRKCVENLLPLPKNYKPNNISNEKGKGRVGSNTQRSVEDPICKFSSYKKGGGGMNGLVNGRGKHSGMLTGGRSGGSGISQLAQRRGNRGGPS